MTKTVSRRIITIPAIAVAAILVAVVFTPMQLFNNEVSQSDTQIENSDQITQILITPFILDSYAQESNFQCSEGMVLVYRITSEKYACLKPSTADRWYKEGIAEPVQQIKLFDEEKDLGSVLRLSRASVPATIPLHQGYYNGEPVFFIITDSSDPKHAEIITASQGWKVEVAPPLVDTPGDSLQTAYMFTNGVEGNGVHGFQAEVLTATPAQPEGYSALTKHIHVTWNDGVTPEILDSEPAVLQAEVDGKVTLSELPVVLNMPQIVWPEGQMVVKEVETLTDDTPYGGGQVLDIDTDAMTVTFVAHRGWGPDGRTIYYLVTDATPSGPAGMMGVVDAPNLAPSLVSPAAVDLFQFKNGIKGSGPLGFQAGIGGSAPGDENYSPLWRINMISWGDPDSASVLETMDDIAALKTAGLITSALARPMDSDHVVNCPFIDPFQ